MKNIIKAIVLFASVAVFSSANAGELTVTGTAKATYNMGSSESTTAQNDTGKSLGITNELAFTGTGELDNGYTWKYQVELDDNASGNTTSDDTRLELTTPYGVIAAYNTEGSLSTKYKASASAYAPGSDMGNSASMQYGTNIDSYNNLQYHTPAGLLPFETSFKVAYAPTADNAKNSSNSSAASTATDANVTQYQLITSPIDGLSLGASYADFDTVTTGGFKKEQGGVFAKYTQGPITIGVGQHRISQNVFTESNFAPQDEISTAANLALIKKFENENASIGYAYNDNLTVSFEVERSTAAKRQKTATSAATVIDAQNDTRMSIDTIQAAYTMGGMTLSVSTKDIQNADYANAKDESEHVFAVVMAF